MIEVRRVKLHLLGCEIMNNTMV